MALYAAVTTGKGSAAIATIQISGQDAPSVLDKVFQSNSRKAQTLEPATVLVGNITDGQKIIDQVTIGCEGPDLFAIHCHGNPLIVEQIAQLMQKHGAVLLTAQEFLSRFLFSHENKSTIESEAKLSQLEARTLAGVKLIANQSTKGLTEAANRWLNNLEHISHDDIRKNVADILDQSKIAKLIIQGCTIVLIGPPNSGKSTLLNTLSGRDKAVVSHIEGTTRDWIQAQCYIEPLDVTLIDTAGLMKSLSETDNNIDRQAQDKSLEMLHEADLVLLVLDASKAAKQFPGKFNKILEARSVLTVLNKSDLPEKFDIRQLPKHLGQPVRISAKQNTGIEELRRRIVQTISAGDFNLNAAIAFTPRQHEIISQLTNIKTKEQAHSLISKLLNDPIAV